MNPLTNNADVPQVAEAVIISGPRKGEFIRLTEKDEELSPEVEAALDALASHARQMAENARSARLAAEALLQTLREAGGVV